MEKSLIVGRSLPLNVLAILINLTGVVFVVMGFHDSWTEQATMFKSIGFGALAISIVMMILFKGFNMMSYVSRILIGGLFIVSGLIKANDPLGFSYKLEEYFEDGALAYRLKEMGWESFSLEAFMDWALAISIFVCIAEIVLGVAVIIGSKMKLAFWSLLLMMGFFTVLTWHTKTCDKYGTYTHTEVYSNDSSNSDDAAAVAMYKDQQLTDSTIVITEAGNTITVKQNKPVQCVNDCGCFGDALKGSVGRSLTPAESFWKDLILLYFVIFIGLAMRKTENNTPRENIVLIPLSLLVVGFFSWVFGWYFPIIFALIVILFPLMMKRMQSKLLSSDWSRAVFVAIACGAFVLYVMYYLPAKDYRPYAVGQSIPDNMVAKRDPVYESVSVYKNKKTGEELSFNMEETMPYTIDGVSKDVPVWQVVMDYEKDDWAWKESVNKELDPGLPATITDFQLKIPMSELGADILDAPEMMSYFETNKEQYFTSYYICEPKDPVAYTDSVLVSDFDASYYPDSTYNVRGPVDVPIGDDLEVDLASYLFAQEKVIMVVMKHLDEVDEGKAKGLKNYLDNLSPDYKVFIFTSDLRESITSFKTTYGFEKYLFANSTDEKELKVVIRANPGFVFLNKGIVKGKWSIHNLQTENDLNKLVD